jgi:hypothetical protein
MRARMKSTVRRTATRRIGVPLWCLILCGFFAAHPAIAQEEKREGKRGDEISKLVGDWSGESVCADKEKFPACNDERVIYHVVMAPGKPETLTITMDKLVNNKPETMAVFDFVYDARSRTLSSEYTRNNRRGLWEFAVTGDLLEGTLVTLPDRTLVRRIKVKKNQ